MAASLVLWWLPYCQVYRSARGKESMRLLPPPHAAQRPRDEEEQSGFQPVNVRVENREMNTFSKQVPLTGGGWSCCVFLSLHRAEGRQRLNSSPQAVHSAPSAMSCCCYSRRSPSTSSSKGVTASSLAAHLCRQSPDGTLILEQMHAFEPSWSHLNSTALLWQLVVLNTTSAETTIPCPWNWTASTNNVCHCYPSLFSWFCYITFMICAVLFLWFSFSLSFSSWGHLQQGKAIKVLLIFFP